MYRDALAAAHDRIAELERANADLRAGLLPPGLRDLVQVPPWLRVGLLVSIAFASALILFVSWNLLRS